MKLFSTTMKIALATFATGISMNAQTADWCAAGSPSQQWEAQMQALIAERAASGDAKTPAGPYVIPVIIHVIHGGQNPGTYPNLSQAQLVSQIHALNEDFGGGGYNFGNYPASAYATWASNAGVSASNLDAFGRVKIANCDVQFCLAGYDTLGNPLPEPGIDRVNYVTKGWTNPATIYNYSSFKNYIDGTVKPNTIWNPTKYFNIWITDEAINSVGLLGYATFPLLSGLGGLSSSFGSATTDGIWVYSRAFGSASYYPSGIYSSGNNRGRTTTHEVGHWLGLRHIWGDGNCANDYCNDTPQASDKNFGTPNYPHKVGNCSTNAPNGEMFMNFMDYTDDGSKYMFTGDQAARMQVCMTNAPYRKFLGTHNLCSVKQMPPIAQFNMATSVCGITNSIMISNYSSGVPVPSFTWSSAAGVTFFPDQYSPSASVTFPAPGTYTIKLSVDNGTLATTQKIVTVNPKPIVLFTPASTTFCPGEEITVTASGGNSYVWYPGNMVGQSITYVAAVEETYTVAVTGPGNCTTLQSITLNVGDCTGIEESGSARFAVYPNPVEGILHVRSSDNSGSSAVIRIADAMGRTALLERVTFTGEAAAIETGHLAPGVYTMSIVTNEGIKVVKLVIGQ